MRLVRMAHVAAPREIIVGSPTVASVGALRSLWCLEVLVGLVVGLRRRGMRIALVTVVHVVAGDRGTVLISVGSGVLTLRGVVIHSSSSAGRGLLLLLGSSSLCRGSAALVSSSSSAPGRSGSVLETFVPCVRPTCTACRGVSTGSRPVSPSGTSHDTSASASVPRGVSGRAVVGMISAVLRRSLVLVVVVMPTSLLVMAVMSSAAAAPVMVVMVMGSLLSSPCAVLVTFVGSSAVPTLLATVLVGDTSSEASSGVLLRIRMDSSRRSASAGLRPGVAGLHVVLLGVAGVVRVLGVGRISSALRRVVLLVTVVGADRRLRLRSWDPRGSSSGGGGGRGGRSRRGGCGWILGSVGSTQGLREIVILSFLTWGDVGGISCSSGLRWWEDAWSRRGGIADPGALRLLHGSIRRPNGRKEKKHRNRRETMKGLCVFPGCGKKRKKKQRI